MSAINKVQDSPEQYTNVHAHFAKLCINAKCYQHALKVIDHPVIRFKTGLENINSGDGDEEAKKPEEGEKGDKKDSKKGKAKKG